MIVNNKNFMLFVLCFFLFLSIHSVLTQSCDYVQNLQVSYRDLESSDWKQTTLNGCIDEQAFKEKSVKEIDIRCKDSKLSQIGQNFVSNLNSLEKLSISECKFETIEPGAFTNLPNLKEILIFKNPLKEIRSGVFNVIPSLTVIHLFLNEISYIEDNAFANLPNLDFIDLNDNQCEYMRREWFPNTTNITTFFMAGNVLRQIPPRMFEGWTKLNWFNLNRNKISQIHNGAFKDISPIITNLDLHLNRLTYISIKSFSESVAIKVLRLSANLFNFIPEDFLKKVNVTYLYVHGNPFKCSCLEQLHWIAHKKGNVIVNNPEDIYFYKPCYSATAPVCATPSTSSSFCKEEIDNEVTQKFLKSFKNSGYDEKDVKCAMFDVLTE